MSGKVIAVVGGQFGSEAKGAISAHLSAGIRPLAAVRVAGPNAGHSVMDPRPSHGKWALRQVPVAAVVNQEALLVIAAGSEVDQEVLQAEVDKLDASGLAVTQRLFVDGSATLVEERHRLAEADAGLTDRIGSTGKGIGAARAERIMRKAWTVNMRYAERWVTPDTGAMLRTLLDQGVTVLIEGTQGYGLGLHTPYYPKCTSSDCRAIDFMAMVGLPPQEVETWVVLRTYPIRVAGESGPMYEETDWETLGHVSGGYIKPEYTTVTQKMRRVGKWDTELARDAVRANGGAKVRVALSFFDYWYPELAGMTKYLDLMPEHHERISQVEHEVGARVRLVGTGPGSVIELD